MKMVRWLRSRVIVVTLKLQLHRPSHAHPGLWFAKQVNILP
jgi:hypothetical protein